MGASWAELRVSGAPLGLILRSRGRLLGSTWASWTPPGPSLGPLGAKWAPNERQLDANWVPTWRPRALPECPQPFRTTLPCTRECKFSKLPFVLSKCSWTCLLAPLGPFLDTFWAQLGASWAPFGLNLGSLGRRWGSSWGLLGASWAPLGPLGCLLGQLGALWAPNGLQMDANWTPNGRQVSAKLGCHNGCKFLGCKNVTAAAKSRRTPCQQYFLSPDGDTMQN